MPDRTSVEDKLLQKDVQLTDAELDLVRRLARAENPDANLDPYEPTIEWFTGKGKEMVMPLSHAPEPKRRFIPSKWEHKKVMKIVRAIRQGRILPKGPKAPEKPDYYGIWSAEDEPLNLDAPMHMPAPKLRLPGHEESYNPPAEYLFSKDELKEWQDTDPSDRKLDFVPAKHDSLRKVPGYDNFVQERFDRCLDLYLAPRSKKRKPKILEGVTKPEDLLPKLPDPKELRPFPTFCSVVYEHPNSTRVRCVSVDPTGTWVLTGAEDGCVRLWECRRGKCLMTWKLDKSVAGPVYSVEWCPDKDKMLFAGVTEGKVSIGAPMTLLEQEDQTALLEYAHAGFSLTGENLPTPVEGVKWSRPTSSTSAGDKGIMLEIEVPGTPKHVSWHKRGDYLATVAPDAGTKAVLMHQITKHSTQAPFRRLKGQVQQAIFHPSRPHFLVATERYVRIYDLMAQSLVKTLQPGVRHVSSLDVHPMGA
jgi:ribosome biogenesis protein ERB1